MDDQPVAEDVPDQRKGVSTFATFQVQDDIIRRFSNLTRLQRVVAYVLRFISNTKLHMDERKVGVLNLQELHLALQTSIRIAQAMEYNKEITTLQAEHQIEKNSKLRSLNPFLCNQGILRVGGRLQNLTNTLSNGIKLSYLRNIISPN